MEVWRAIKGYENIYEVSNLGRVKSLKRIAESKKRSSQRIKERILKPDIDTKGYFQVNLMQKSFRVHKLVAITFLNHKPDGNKGLVIDHKNENKLDNRLNNLQLITNQENLDKSRVINNLINKE